MRLRLAIPGAMLVVHAGVAATQPAPVPIRPSETIDVLFSIVERRVLDIADAMPANKYPFVPASGEFTGVRTFGQQLKHLAATNFILAAGALEAAPPIDAGDEMGPERVRTKAEIIAYVRASFTYLRSAMVAADSARQAIVKSPPISPFPAGAATRIGLVIESLIHAYDHYGQMVVYLRMNNVVPPASR